MEALTLLATCFPAFGAGIFATVAAGTMVATGAGARPTWTGAVADADAASLYSHAAPIAGARLNTVNAAAANALFMADSSI
jgi:hypothetical protein